MLVDTENNARVLFLMDTFSAITINLYPKWLFAPLQANGIFTKCSSTKQKATGQHAGIQFNCQKSA